MNLILATLLLAQSMFAGLPIDGVACQSSEGAVEHIHVHLQIFNRGHAVKVPAYIGMPAGSSCLYWLHTHAANGIIHIESPIKRGFTLGQFFDIWGVGLSRTQADGIRAPRGKMLRVTVDGRLWKGDPRSIPLRDHEEIVIQEGPPFTAGHPADWSQM